MEECKIITQVKSINTKDNSSIVSTLNIISYIGDGLLELIGYSKDQIVGKKLSEVFVKLLRLPQEKLEQMDISGNIECYIFTKSLEAREVTISCLQGQDAGKKIYSIEEKPNSRLNDKLIFEDQLFKDNIIGCSIYSVPDLILLKANEKYFDFMDPSYNTMEKSIGLSLWESVPGYKGSNSEELFLTIMKTGLPGYYNEFKYDHYERGITYWDGSIIPIYVDKKVKYIYQTCTEITQKIQDRNSLEEQKKTIKFQNDQLRQQNEQLEAVLENMTDALFIIDSEGHYVKINKAGKELFYSIEMNNFGDVHAASKFYDLSGKEVSKEELPYALIRKGETVSDQQMIHKYGEQTRYIGFSGTPVYNESGEFSSAVICAHNMTNSIKNQMLIRDQQDIMLQTEKEKNDALLKEMEMKDEFLTLVSHEFKTPLTVINSAIQAMELICKDELTDKAKGLLNKIRHNSNRQLKLVNNLLDITRVSSGHLKMNKTNKDIVLITRLITESITIFAEQKHIALLFSSTLGRKVIGIDEEIYEKILLNLLSNAIKYSPEGKSIAVKISQKIVNGKCMVCIQVKDNGVGIPEDKKDLVFKKFGQVDTSLTRQAEGTGIGLHLVHMLVEIMGGEITLESKVGEGSIFTVLLPGEKAKVVPFEQKKNEITDNRRLIQATAIEFSDIY